MASGDTKTEALLNILGNGGSGDEYRGCCNTKTQQYILDAIDRINSLSPGGGVIKTLTDADAKGEYEGEKYVELWTLPSGIYVKDANTDFTVAYALEEDAPSAIVSTDSPAIFLVYNNGDDYANSITQTSDTIAYVATDGSGNIVEPLMTFGSIFSGTDGDNAGTAGLVPAPASTDLGKFLSADGRWANVPGGSAIKTLTAADYNYPTNSPDRVNPAMLPSGFYQLADSSVYIQEEAKKNNRQERLYYVSEADGNGYNYIFDFFGNGMISSGWHPITIFRGVPSTGAMSRYNSLVGTDEAAEYLYSKQGTQDPTVTPTAGTVGQIYVKTDTQDAYVCVSANGGIYTWKKITTT